MPASVPDTNDTAASSPPSVTGAATQVKDDHDLTSGSTDTHKDTSTIGHAAQDSSKESPSHHHGIRGMNGVSESDNSTNTPVLQVESVSNQNDIDSLGGVHQPVSSGSADATKSSQSAAKPKRGKRTSVNPSSHEASSEDRSGMVLKFGLNKEQALRRTAFSS
jgi:hypothetical protein